MSWDSGAFSFAAIANHMPALAPWLGPLAAAVLALALLWPRIRGKLAERRMRRVVEALARDFIRDAVLPDGMDGVTHVDYLLLLPGQVVVIDIKKYQGFIFAGENIDQWTQVVGNRSYKFPNPLYKSEMDVMAVRTRITQAQVTGRVVFASEGSFPKGRPPGVCMLEDLQAELSTVGAGADIAPALRNEWLGLRAAGLEVERSGTTLMLRNQQREHRSGLLAALALLALSLGWAGWLLRQLWWR